MRVLLLLACALAIIDPNDLNGLNAIKNGMGFAGWQVQTGWNAPGTDPCVDLWNGVICDSTDTYVTVLFLGFNGLTGQFPTELGTLIRLTDLMMQSNSISGALPSEMGFLQSLRVVYLFNNQLTAQLPSQLSNLKNLTKLDIHGNFISGTLPGAYSGMTSLQQFFASDNLLSGTLPASYSSLLNLAILELQNNRFVGILPSGWSTAKFKILRLSNNQISGEVPLAWATFATTLSVLEIANNSLGCLVPTFLAVPTLLSAFDGNPYLCPIPASIASEATCLQSTLDSFSPVSTDTTYTGTFTITGTGFQPSCSQVPMLISPDGTQAFSMPVITFTSTTIVAALPTGIGSGGWDFKLANPSNPTAPVAGVSQRINLVKLCPGYPTYPTGCDQGFCLTSGVCKCNTGYNGPACNLTCSQLINCGAHGTCFLVTLNVAACQCDANYYGVYCNVTGCNPTCVVGQGTCDVSTQTCVCDPGYEGLDCGTEKDCNPPCPLNAQCVKVGSDGVRYTDPACVCDDGYYFNPAGECVPPEELSGNSSFPTWALALIIVLAIVLIAVAVFVIIKCRFKPPKDGQEMKPM